MNSNKRLGTYIRSAAVAGESYSAYMPAPLPPNPKLDLEVLYPLLDQANTAIGRLDGMSMVLPDPSLFLYMYIRKEAVLSSQIEGTQSSLSDLLLHENTDILGVPFDDVAEVSCYVAAMNYGLGRLSELPLSLRLLKEIHAKLMDNARGGNKQPGEFRTSQNWIGGSRPGNALFVPPPPEKLMECLSDFENFIHDKKGNYPILIKAALLHVQFETIHPFLDGNGRLGRLLITLLLCAEGILKQPLLYLSLYFKTNRQEYYNHLQSVRQTGDWESWISFFLKGVIETANQATETAQSILKIFANDRRKIEEANSAAAVLTLHNCLQQSPIANTPTIRKITGLSQPTVIRSLTALETLGIVREITGKARHKVFIYNNYLDLLSKGTEPLSHS